MSWCKNTTIIKLINLISAIYFICVAVVGADVDVTSKQLVSQLLS